MSALAYHCISVSNCLQLSRSLVNGNFAELCTSHTQFLKCQNTPLLTLKLSRLDNNNENEDDLGKKDVTNNKDITNSAFSSSSVSSLLSKSNISSEQRMMESNSFLKEAISAAHNRRSASPLSPTTATKKSRDKFLCYNLVITI